MTAAQVVRFAAVVSVLAGYALVFRAGEARLAAHAGENARLEQRLREVRGLLARRPALERRAAALRGPAGRRRDDDERDVTGRFVREAAAVTAGHHTTLVAVTAAAAVPQPASGATPAGGPQPAIGLEVQIAGRYRDVLATVTALVRRADPARIEIASLARTGAGAASVTAVLRVAVERLGAPAAASDAR